MPRDCLVVPSLPTLDGVIISIYIIYVYLCAVLFIYLIMYDHYDLVIFQL